MHYKHKLNQVKRRYVYSTCKKSSKVLKLTSMQAHTRTESARPHEAGSSSFDEVEMQPRVVELLSNENTKLDGAELTLGRTIDPCEFENSMLGKLLKAPIDPERLYGYLLMCRAIEAAIAESPHHS